MRAVRHLGLLLSSISLACGGSSETGLPNSFGDCASPPCEVALEAFTKDPTTLPHCPSAQDEVDLSCPAASSSETGACEGKWAVRYVYGFPGDFYQCIYDSDTEALVGAKWAPDSHPVQFAGEQLAADCVLMQVCDG
ncbi:MAG: hypothetical protein ACN4G0_17585 [Polyangiales bacterium]